MRPTTTALYKTKTQGVSDEIKMGIDENSVAFLMDILTNLYSDPVAAPIREYSSNARDSHIEAGKAHVPIEVTLPTYESPTFVVQDFGMGMSVDDLHHVYSKYGFSTKRTTNEQAGMLGLGSKSGLAYASQFTVTAVKGGVKTLATVSRGQDGSGVIKILDTSDTNDPSGVRISIPVSNVSLFNDKARHIFKFWTPGTVLVNGKQPDNILDNKYIKADDDLFIIGGSVLGSDYVVMGEVAYPVDNKLSYSLPWGYSVVLYVPMGAVNFPPNREELRYTDRTNAVIEDAVKRRDANLETAALEDIKKAKTHYEALRAADTWRGLLRNKPLEYNGEPIPKRIYIDGGKNDLGYQINLPFYYIWEGRTRNMERREIDASEFIECFVIKNYTNKTLSSNNRRKIAKYAMDNDLTNRYVIAEKVVGGPWADGMTIVDWDDIKTIRLNAATSRSTGGGKVAVYEPTGQGGHQRDHVEIDDIEGDDLVTVSPATFNYDNDQDYVSPDQLSKVLPDATFVVLARNRWEKFARDHDNVRTVDEALTVAHDAAFDALNDYEYTVIMRGNSLDDTLKRLDPDKFKDPDVADLVRDSLAVDAERLSMYRSASNLYRRVTGQWTSKADSRPDVTQAVLDKYPLMKYSREIDTEHVYDYVNALYERNAL